MNNPIELLAKLVAEKRIDIVVLAESSIQTITLKEELGHSTESSFHEPHAETGRLQLVCRDSEFNLREIYGDANGRVTIRVLRIGSHELLLAAAHLPSKVNWSPEDQSTQVQSLSKQIRDEEERRRNSRTILFGDFNMNPFEAGVVKAAGLHAMMAKSITENGGRVVQGETYPFFYNPMWGFFGDRTEGPPGTVYHRHSGHLSYEWNIFDQVLIRPDALPWFPGTIEIVTRIGTTDLLRSNGRPDRAVASDHLPLLFQLSECE